MFIIMSGTGHVGSETAKALLDEGHPVTVVSPQALNFKFYRQATNKVVGITDETAAFLGDFF